MVSLKRLNTKTILKTIFEIAKKRKVKLYLVGGYLRDMLLKKEKENPDMDFCLKKGAISFARYVSGEIKAGFVVLDKIPGFCRLVKKLRDKTYTLDFTDFRGNTIEEDLLHRDFTINAAALELEKIFTPLESPAIYGGDEINKDLIPYRKGGVRAPSFLTGFTPHFPISSIIDPYNGTKDLKSKLIRLVNKKGFDEDPLRILRAFSLACMLDFKIDKQTLRLIRLKRNKLSSVSYERIRDELFKILDRPSSFNFLLQLDKLKILKIIIPQIEVMRNVKQGPYHHLDVYNHTLETIRQLEILIEELKGKEEIQTYLNEVISDERTRFALIKLGALLHDIGKPHAMRRENGKAKFHGHERIGLEITEEIVKCLRLSNDEFDSLKKMILYHLRPGYLADNKELTPRAIFRYFRDTASEAVSTLLLSIADQRATKGPLASRESRIHHERMALGLIKEYFRRKKEKKLLRLITGDVLIKKFKLEPSPLIGKILKEIEELQAIGKIKTKKEALKIAQKFIKRKI